MPRVRVLKIRLDLGGTVFEIPNFLAIMIDLEFLNSCFRPFSDDELRSNAPQVITCNEYQREVAVSQSIAGKHIDRVFTFDKVHNSKPKLFIHFWAEFVLCRCLKFGILVALCL